MLLRESSATPYENYYYPCYDYSHIVIKACDRRNYCLFMHIIWVWAYASHSTLYLNEIERSKKNSL